MLIGVGIIGAVSVLNGFSLIRAPKYPSIEVRPSWGIIRGQATLCGCLYGLLVAVLQISAIGFTRFILTVMGAASVTRENILAYPAFTVSFYFCFDWFMALFHGVAYLWFRDARLLLAAQPRLRWDWIRGFLLISAVVVLLIRLDPSGWYFALVNVGVFVGIIFLNVTHWWTGAQVRHRQTWCGLVLMATGAALIMAMVMLS